MPPPTNEEDYRIPIRAPAGGYFGQWCVKQLDPVHPGQVVAEMRDEQGNRLEVRAPSFGEAMHSTSNLYVYYLEKVAEGQVLGHVIRSNIQGQYGA